MALVICCVLRTELIRLRIALRVAMRHFRFGFKIPRFKLTRNVKPETRNLSLEYPLKLFQRLGQLGAEVAV
jgi:hypothetical protein